jgi:DNA-binding CsgD family transcriptional regulator
VALARERGLLGLVPRALHEYAIALVGHGRFAAAYAAAEESLRLGTDIGQRWGASWNLATLASLDAIRGDEPRAVAHADEAIELASLNGALLVLGFARRALGLLDLTVGRPGEATDRLLAAASDANAILALWAIPDLVEAAAGSDRIADAAPHLDRYADWVARAPSAARLCLLARCEALAGRGDPRERFAFALAHGHAVSPFQQARTALLFGEWLRRRRARAEARPQLRRAAELFRQVGTRPWAARAEAELRATGEKPRRRDPSTLDDLTPQELQIAGLVAAGMTNREIAAQLYLSPRTIDYHLRKVFTKLGLTSRTDLVRLGVPA